MATQNHPSSPEGSAGARGSRRADFNKHPEPACVFLRSFQHEERAELKITEHRPHQAFPAEMERCAVTLPFSHPEIQSFLDASFPDSWRQSYPSKRKSYLQKVLKLKMKAVRELRPNPKYVRKRFNTWRV